MPDNRLRQNGNGTAQGGLLVLPKPREVDFRAACFCHKRIIDMGYVCSVCLSSMCVFVCVCVCV